MQASSAQWNLPLLDALEAGPNVLISEVLCVQEE